MSTFAPFAGTSISPSALPPFTSMFLFPFEYNFFGLQNSSQEPDIDALVQHVSHQIDIFYVRIECDGLG